MLHLDAARPMSLSLRPHPPCEPGKGGESNFFVETPRLSVPHTGFWPVAAGSFHRGKRSLCLSCFRGPRLEAAFNIFRKESGEEPKEHSKYFSAILVEGTVFMTPVKLRVRASSRGPPLVQSQKAFFSIGKDEEALQKSVINSLLVSNKGGGALRPPEAATAARNSENFPGQDEDLRKKTCKTANHVEPKNSNSGLLLVVT
ncbi:hypothetical protein NDU88_002633 [Pleurodeles waltl]|uniref:Uncharacterized protein n=1 Tax=Pleurodeles waltl TaxID=8319 RepID=A0AAV7W3M5_PLEWA|nr:hypothetical protein NDU88_002633 [Pleurodeles waltl]